MLTESCKSSLYVAYSIHERPGFFPLFYFHLPWRCTALKRLPGADELRSGASSESWRVPVHTDAHRLVTIGWRSEAVIRATPPSAVRSTDGSNGIAVGQ